MKDCAQKNQTSPMYFFLLWKMENEWWGKTLLIFGSPPPQKKKDLLILLAWRHIRDSTSGSLYCHHNQIHCISKKKTAQKTSIQSIISSLHDVHCSYKIHHKYLSLRTPPKKKSTKSKGMFFFFRCSIRQRTLRTG